MKDYHYRMRKKSAMNTRGTMMREILISSDF